MREVRHRRAGDGAWRRFVQVMNTPEAVAVSALLGFLTGIPTLLGMLAAAWKFALCLVQAQPQCADLPADAAAQAQQQQVADAAAAQEGPVHGDGEAGDGEDVGQPGGAPHEPPGAVAQTGRLPHRDPSSLATVVEPPAM